MTTPNPAPHATPLDTDTLDLLAGISAATGMGTNARATIVNRTHRVVRERAEQMQTQRKNVRSLMLPLAICSILLLMLSYAAWTVFSAGAAGFGTVETEIEQQASKLLPTVDTDGPGTVLFLWFLPVSAVALGTVMFTRSRGRGEDEVRR